MGVRLEVEHRELVRCLGAATLQFLVDLFVGTQHRIGASASDELGKFILFALPAPLGFSGTQEGLRRVAGKLLVGQVRIVEKLAGRLDDIDAATAIARLICACFFSVSNSIWNR